MVQVPDVGTEMSVHIQYMDVLEAVACVFCVATITAAIIPPSWVQNKAS